MKGNNTARPEMWNGTNLNEHDKRNHQLHCDGNGGEGYGEHSEMTLNSQGVCLEAKTTTTSVMLKIQIKMRLRWPKKHNITVMRSHNNLIQQYSKVQIMTLKVLGKKRPCHAKIRNAQLLPSWDKKKPDCT